VAGADVAGESVGRKVTALRRAETADETGERVVYR